jgi:hypothetical protein
VFALISCQVFPLVPRQQLKFWRGNEVPPLEVCAGRIFYCLLLLLVWLLPLLAIKTRQNADLAGRSLVPNFTGRILNSCEAPSLGLGGRGSEIQLDG